MLSVLKFNNTIILLMKNQVINTFYDNCIKKKELFDFDTLIKYL